jgi:hypothetical protein
VYIVPANGVAAAVGAMLADGLAVGAADAVAVVDGSADADGMTEPRGDAVGSADGVTASVPKHAERVTSAARAAGTPIR